MTLVASFLKALTPPIVLLTLIAGCTPRSEQETSPTIVSKGILGMAPVQTVSDSDLPLGKIDVVFDYMLYDTEGQPKVRSLERDLSPQEVRLLLAYLEQCQVEPEAFFSLTPPADFVSVTLGFSSGGGHFFRSNIEGRYTLGASVFKDSKGASITTCGFCAAGENGLWEIDKETCAVEFVQR